jgi:hypothetical protein
MAMPHLEAANSYHGQLLRDYIDFIAHLDILSTQFAIDWSDERGDFFGVDSDIRRLQPIRLHDLIDKMRYAQLEQWIGDALGSEGFSVAHGGLCDGHDGQPGQLLIDAGMTRGVGLFDLKYFVMNKHRLGNPVILGVQVQGNQFRLVVETRTRNKAFEIAKALWQQGAESRLWFDFGLLPGGSGEYPQKRDFNQYSGVFFYRSKKLGSISPKRLADTIIAYVRSIRTNQIAICQQIEMILQNTDGNLTA